LHLRVAAQRRAAPGHQGQRVELGDVVQRLRPVLEVGVSGVGGGVEFDQVARQQRLLARQPHHGVALGVATAQLQQLHFQLAQPQGHLAGEGHGRPGQAFGHGLQAAEQAREASDLAGLVLLAALDDEVVGVLAGQDLLRLVGAGAQHAHGVVVGEHHVLDGLVGDFADAADHVGSHGGRGLGVGHQHGVVANDDAGVRVAFGRVGPGMFRDLFEGDLFFFKVGCRGERLGAHIGFR